MVSKYVQALFVSNATDMRPAASSRCNATSAEEL